MEYGCIAERLGHSFSKVIHAYLADYTYELCELSPEMFSDTVKDITDKERKLADAMKTMLGINPKVHLVAPKSITRSEGKAVRVVDKRKLH